MSCYIINKICNILQSEISTYEESTFQKTKHKVENTLTTSIIYHPANGPRTVSQFLKYNQYQMNFPYEYSILGTQH